MTEMASKQTPLLAAAPSSAATEELEGSPRSSDAWTSSRKNVSSLEELMEMWREVMGIRDEELVEGIESDGVATFLGDALSSRVSLFI